MLSNHFIWKLQYSAAKCNLSLIFFFDNKDFLAHIFDIIPFSLSLLVIVLWVFLSLVLNSLVKFFRVFFFASENSKFYSLVISCGRPETIYFVVKPFFGKFWSIPFTVDKSVCMFLRFKISKICLYWTPFYLIPIIPLFVFFSIKLRTFCFFPQWNFHFKLLILHYYFILKI